MTANFDFDNATIFLHFDITRVDGELTNELENYLYVNLIKHRRKGDSLYVENENCSYGVSLVRYETSVKNVNLTYFKELHEDIYEYFSEWVLIMGGIENVAD